jgi:ABC-type spermidine/putrescine transport system permease subunit II
MQKVTMTGGIRPQAFARSLMISTKVVISYLVGVFVALCLSRFAFLGKTVLALWEVLKLPLLPGLYLGEVLLPQIEDIEQPRPIKFLLSIMLNIGLYTVCIYPIVASSIEPRTGDEPPHAAFGSSQRSEGNSTEEQERPRLHPADPPPKTAAGD